MTNDPVFQRFREISWRRALTDAEQADLEAWLKANPQFRAEWDAELSLSSSLDHLPNPSVPSNFTARVLQAIEQETLAENRSRTPNRWWQHLAKRVQWAMGTSAATLVVIIGFVIHGHQVQRQQYELALAKSVVTVSKQIPNTEVLANFDTIRALSQAPPRTINSLRCLNDAFPPQLPESDFDFGAKPGYGWGRPRGAAGGG